jgi:N6-adenosine-specific RNA methylase IME4
MKNKALQAQEWYQELVKECHAIIVERLYNSNLEAITAYGEVGQRIFEDENYKKFGKGNRIFNLQLFKDVGIGETTGYRCLEFYERKLKEEIKNQTYRDVLHAVQNKYPKNISWKKIIAELPEPKENKIVIPPPEGTYNVIIIDPPWPYGTEYDAETRRVASPYPEQSIEKIREFPIPSAPDCVMWLWTTHKFLPTAFELIKYWEFEYKITFVWDKQKMGMGAWLRCQTEFCLLGIKGNPKWELTNERDILSEARREHSRKPDAFYKMVKRLTPGARRIDYFSREKRNGFDQYGNETNKF